MLGLPQRRPPVVGRDVSCKEVILGGLARSFVGVDILQFGVEGSPRHQSFPPLVGCGEHFQLLRGSSISFRAHQDGCGGSMRVSTFIGVTSVSPTPGVSRNSLGRPPFFKPPGHCNFTTWSPAWPEFLQKLVLPASHRHQATPARQCACSKPIC